MWSIKQQGASWGESREFWAAEWDRLQSTKLRRYREPVPGTRLVKRFGMIPVVCARVYHSPVQTCCIVITLYYVITLCDGTGRTKLASLGRVVVENWSFRGSDRRSDRLLTGYFRSGDKGRARMFASRGHSVDASMFLVHSSSTYALGKRLCILAFSCNSFAVNG